MTFSAMLHLWGSLETASRSTWFEEIKSGREDCINHQRLIEIWMENRPGRVQRMERDES